MKKQCRQALVAFAWPILAACSASAPGSGGSRDAAEKASETLLRTGGNGDDWAGIGYSYYEQRFSR